MKNKNIKNIGKDIKIVIVGDGDVGKTSMLVSYTTNQFPSEYTPTVFDNYSVTFLLNGNQYNLSLVDTAGQEDYRSIISLSFQNADIFIVCFSLNNPNSLVNVEDYWCPLLSQQCPKVPIILAGTKSDVAKTVISNFVSSKEAMHVAKKIGALQYHECSALTQMGLKQIFDSAIMAVIDGERRQKTSKGLTNQLCSLV